MELGRIDRARLDRRGELDPVLAPGDANGAGRHLRDRSPATLRQATFGGSRARRPRYNGIIRVDEVEVGARRDALEEAQLTRMTDAVPAHVRDLPARREPPHRPRDHAETAPLAELLARREQELVAETDAEKWPAPVQRPPEGREESEALEVRHRLV